MRRCLLLPFWPCLLLLTPCWECVVFVFVVARLYRGNAGSSKRSRSQQKLLVMMARQQEEVETLEASSTVGATQPPPMPSQQQTADSITHARRVDGNGDIEGADGAASVTLQIQRLRARLAELHKVRVRSSSTALNNTRTHVCPPTPAVTLDVIHMLCTPGAAACSFTEGSQGGCREGRGGDARRH